MIKTGLETIGLRALTGVNILIALRRALILCATILFVLPSLSFAAPNLFFSDLESGPKTGWEGSKTKGAAVSVWGTGFGSTRGANYVTVNGAPLASDSDYAEWGVTSNNARGLERTTFWLNNNAAGGAGSITVTVNGETSNPLPFTVRSGNIYFIAKDGSNLNNGRYASDRRGFTRKGPWLSFTKTNGQKNRALKAGDIIYVRSGTYNDIGEQRRMIYYRGLNYSKGKPLAVVGYPGEYPVLGTTVEMAIYTGANYGQNSYLEWHKMIFENRVGALQLNGHDFRIVGNIFRNNTADVWTGIIWGGSMWNSQILGNIWRNTGYDNYKHAIYLTGETWDKNATLNHAISNIHIAWNEFDHYIGDANSPRHMGGGTIEIKSKDNPNWTNSIYVYNNYFKDVTANLMWVSGNCYNIYFFNNLAINSSHAATGSSRGGLVWGTNNTDSRFYQYNNTFYNIGDSPEGYNIGATYVRKHSGLQSTNNIYYSVGGQPYLIISNWSDATYTSDHDLYYGNGSPPSGKGIKVTNALNVDPRFSDTSSSDFTLKPTSPAINAGTSLVSTVVSNDFNGLTRPQSAGYDVGAYEYGQ